MAHPPLVFLDSLFGASVQQIFLDLNSSSKFILECIHLLDAQVGATPSGDLKLWRARDISKITQEFNVHQRSLSTLNEAFNYLIIFLDQLPRPLLPETAINSTFDPLLSDFRPVAPPEGDILVGVQNLIIKVRKSNLKRECIELFEKEIRRSLVKRPRSQSSVSSLAKLFVTGSSYEFARRRFQETFREDKAVLVRLMTEDAPRICLGEPNRRRKEFQAHMNVFLAKLEALSVASLSRYVNEYHYQQFVERMKALFRSFDKQIHSFVGKTTTRRITRLFDSRYLYADVQKQLIGIQYHLDIFIYHILKELNVDWSSDEKMKTTFDDAVAIYDIESQARRFWSDVFGADKVIAHRKHFITRFRERCVGASVLDSYDMDRFLALLDSFRTDFVTLFTFSDLMRSFGNNISLIKEALYFPGFHGTLDTEGARLLDGQNRGTYLIRFGNHLTIHYVCTKQDIVQHQEIVFEPIGFQQPPPKWIKLKNKDGEYTSLGHMISSNDSWKEPFLTFTTDTAFIGDLSVEEVDILPLYQYVLRLSSQSGFVALTCGGINGSDRINNHLRMKVVGRKIQINEKLYHNFSECLRLNQYTSNLNLEPFVQRNTVYQTENEASKSLCYEVVHSKSIDAAYAGKDAITFKTKFINIDAAYSSNVEARMSLIAKALLENSSLTSIKLKINLESVPILEALQCHPSIRELNITFTTFPDDGAFVPAKFTYKDAIHHVTEPLIALVSSLSRIEILALNDWSTNLADVIRGIAGVSTLRKLSADRLSVQDFQELSKSSSITTLEINSVEDISAIKALTNVKELIIKYPSNDMWTIREHATTLTKLQFLFQVADAESEDLEKLYRSTSLQFHCTLDHHPQCNLWKSTQSTSLYWSSKSINLPCCRGAIQAHKFELDTEKLRRIERLRLHKIASGKTIDQSLAQMVNLKSLALDNCTMNDAFISVIKCLTSLRALSFTGCLDQDSPKVRTLPNHLTSLIWFDNGRTDERQVNRRYRMTSEIQDWIVSMINIVHCSSLFNKLPVEIWELIVIEFSFMKPFLDPIYAFRMISGTNQKVIKVVDWDVVGRLLEENSWIRRWH